MLQILVIVSLSVTVAMYALIQLYICVAVQLAEKRPLLKLFSIKAVGKLLPGSGKAESHL
jgi:hypothetical protein